MYAQGVFAGLRYIFAPKQEPCSRAGLNIEVLLAAGPQKLLGEKPTHQGQRVHLSRAQENPEKDHLLLLLGLEIFSLQQS